ncbi:TY1B-DR3, partial [Symbiodinium sp. CCMP2456]
ELILEEVRKQVQQAMSDRDAEVKGLKEQNEELKQALQSSAQLLNEVMAAGGCGGGGSPSLQASREPPGLELGGNPRGVDRSLQAPLEAPPDHDVSAQVPGGNPWLRGRAETSTRVAAGGSSDRPGVRGGSPIRETTAKTGIPQFGPLEDSGVREAGEGDPRSSLELLVQGMRQLQQVYMDKKNAGEAENLKGVNELAPLPELTGDTGVEFSDWLYVSEQAIGAMSDSASLWFERTLGAARDAYARYQMASPLERLAITPRVAPELMEPRWVRLDRKVMTLVLAAMPKMVKEDAVTHRVTSVAMALYRLHVLYSPGGMAERAAILKHLEGTSAGENISDVVAALRKWRRYLTRSEEMRLTAPDPSILLKGVETIIGSCVQRHSEMSFRLSLARNELQLQNRPTTETVMKFYDHALAEMQQALPVRWAARPSEQPRMKALGAGTGEASSSSSPTASPQRGQKGNAASTPCKFFASDSGCRRGQACKFQHEFASRDERRARCWTCGSKQHRQSECPVRDAAKAAKDKGNGGNNGPKAAGPSAASQRLEAKATAPTPSTTASSTLATLSSTANAEGGQNVVQAEPVLNASGDAVQSPEFQTFMREVNTMLQKMTRLNMLEVRPQLNSELAQLDMQMASFDERLEPMALLDSGATHPFRRLPPVHEDGLHPAQVQLADGKAITLQQNRAGTLMPLKEAVAQEEGATTIVPLGTLVQELGCTVNWDRKGLHVHHPRHGVISTHVAGSCPFIGETKALELIGEIETRKLEQLKLKTVQTQLMMIGVEAELGYDVRMNEYRRTGSRTEGLKALMAKDSVFGELSEAQRCMLVQDIDLSDEAGKRYLKALPIRRAMRRRLLSTKWLVNLCSGTGGQGGFKALESENITLLDVDLKLSRAFNLREPSVAYRALLWAAMRGQLEGVFGSPPRGEGAQPNGAQYEGGDRDAPELYLLKALEPPEDETLDDALLTLTENQNQLLEDLQERAERLRFMIEEEEILAEECRRAGQQTSEEVENVRAYLDDMMDEANLLRTVNHAKATDACLKAMITHEEPDYERLLQNLEGDLEVVHTVPLDQVRAALDNWMEALEKEVNQLLEGTLKPMPLSRARELEKKGLLKLVPSKGVYILKPPSVKGKKVRRKFRLVLCGNHVGRDDEAFNLYASGVSADTVRLALAFAAHRRWSGGTSDVTGAFLLAEWPDHLARYAIFPPKVLVEAGLARADEAWEVIRPLYGLRESPAIWAKCRTDRLREAKIAYQGRTIALKQSVGDPELWLAFDEDEVMRAKSLIAALHSWVQEAWPCSELEWADSKGYIRELLRAYDMEETLSTKLPCPREWLGEDSEEENYTVQELKQGQKAVGEQLWLMMRCRPDLQFPVGYLAAKVSKQPNRVVQIAKRLLAYLKATVSMKMVIGATRPETELPNMAAWSDASFSPHGEKSYGASVVTINGSPIAWKASKQAFVTLSVMEAELLEASTATLLMENIGCLLDEICGSRVERKLFVDNASAVAMLVGGPGSWRTRHLKVRSARLREQVEAQELAVNHVNGTAQIADLATKMHPKMRLWELLSMWGFEGLPGDAVEALQSKATYLACLVLAMMCQPTEAKEVSAASIQVAGMDELLLVTVLVCIATVAVWEAAKWAFQCVKRACKESPKQGSFADCEKKTEQQLRRRWIEQ